MINFLYSTFRALIRDRAANVAIITAFSALPLIGLMGLAIDYGTDVVNKAKLDAASDAAALAAINSAQAVLQAGGSSATAISQGQSLGAKAFSANAGALSFATVTAPIIQVVPAGLDITSSVSYSVTETSNFGKLFGTSQSSWSGSSAASLKMAGYANIYVIVDVSSSMGIGATASDQQITYNATGGCAVACHYTGTTASARAAGATLRIDVAKQGITAALNQFASSGTKAQVAIYTMSDKFTNVFSLSNNLSAAVTAVNAIDISNSANDGGTDTTYTLSQLNNLLPTPGNGQTQATAQGIVMLITDGVQDSDMKYYSGGNWLDQNDPNFTVFSPCNQSSCTYNSAFGLYFESFDPTKCSPIKTKGYTMMTLDVKYLIPPANLQSSSSALNDVFSYIQQNLLQSIPANMSACATSASLAFSASTPSEITAAVASMFNASITVAHLTQ